MFLYFRRGTLPTKQGVRKGNGGGPSQDIGVVDNFSCPRPRIVSRPRPDKHFVFWTHRRLHEPHMGWPGPTIYNYHSHPPSGRLKGNHLMTPRNGQNNEHRWHPSIRSFICLSSPQAAGSYLWHLDIGGKGGGPSYHEKSSSNTTGKHNKLPHTSSSTQQAPSTFSKLKKYPEILQNLINADQLSLAVSQTVQFRPSAYETDYKIS